MMKLNKYIAIIILIIIVLLQASPYFITVIFGQTVHMYTHLYDPRDIFRGDYVNIQFNEEELQDRIYVDEHGKTLQFNEDARKEITSSVSPATDLDKYLPAITVTEDYFPKKDEDGDYIYSDAPLYASLDEINGIWRVHKISGHRPKDGIYIKASRTGYYGEEFCDLDFNLGRVYIPEGTGYEWENLDDDYVLIATLKVFKGRAVITDLNAVKQP